MMISEKIEVEDGSLVAGGFADVRIGRHKGHLVAVKTLRIAPADDFQKIKKVSTNATVPDSQHWH